MRDSTRTRSVRLIALGCLFPALLLGCSDAPTEPDAAPEAAPLFQISGGNEQTGAAGEELPEPLMVQATDGRGKRLSGVLVSFHVMSGGGSLFAGSSVTNKDGIAWDYWTLGTRAGTAQTVEVRAIDPETGEKRVYATFTAVAHAGPPAALESVTCPGVTSCERPSIVGTPMQWLPSVRVTDRFGNATPGATVTFTSFGTGGILSGAEQVSDAQGIATLGEWIVSTVAWDLDGVTASLAGSSAQIHFTTIPAAGPAADLVAYEHPTSAPAGTWLGAAENRTSLYVFVVDQYGNTIGESVGVTWTVLEGGGCIAPDGPWDDICRTSWELETSGYQSEIAWRLGASPGVNRVRAGIYTADGPAEVILTATGT